MTQDTEWDLFRTFEAVARRGSLTDAAKSLGVSQSTVSRQLSRLETEAGALLFVRSTPIQLTQRGAALLAAVQPMVDAAVVARAALANTLEVRGLVTLTTVGELVRWVLARHLGSFYRSFPHVRLKILAGNQIDSLAAGEADIALRMARPDRGDLVSKRVGSEEFGYFAVSSLDLHPEVAWLALTGSLARIPEQRHADRAFSSRPPRLLVEDVESLALAVQAGLGVAILPRNYAARLEGLVEVDGAEIGAADMGPVPTREIWLVVHRSKRHVPTVRAVLGWLEQVFSELSSPPKIA